MLSRVVRLGSILFAGCLSTSALPAAPAELPPRVIATTDQAEFRRFVLDNGLKVLLVSDPHFNKSAASLVVETGQMDDPYEHVGLAHFTEHMLFLGTEKYPDVDDYGSYMSANGGYNNAYTSSDHTNYQFQVSNDALPGALDRFAQFFIAPLFTAEFTAREVNAVNNEAMRHVQNDGRRMLQVRRELYNQAAGESKFSTGNKDTLANADRDIVRAFYEAHYSADRMALAIAGTASLDELEKMAREDFGAIPRRDIPPVTREPIYLPKLAALRLATIEPVKEVRTLELEFLAPATRPDFTSKPGEFVTALLNYAGPGGLVEALKAADLATSIGGGLWERTAAYGSFFIQADLTPHGAENVNLVLETIFAYLQHLAAAPFPTDFYADQARIAALEETYNDRGEGASLVTDLANNALFYPLDIAERAELAWGAPDESAYRRFLAALTPDNVQVAFQAKGVPTDRQEKIYGTAYGYTETTGEDYDRLVHPDVGVAFSLPAANPFMPDETGLLAERPLRLIDEPGLSLHYAQDIEFERPRATLMFRFVPARSTATPETDLLLRFYEICLEDAIESAAGDAAIAGVTYSINAALEGLTVTVSGFGDSPARFADYVAGQLLTFEVAPTRFASLKERVIRSLRSFEQTEAYQLAAHRLNATLREFYYLPDHSLAQAPGVTWQQVRDGARQYFAAGKIEALVHGHLTAEQATTATRAVAAAIGGQPLDETKLLRRRHLQIIAGEPIIDTGRIEGTNSVYRSHYLTPTDNAANRAAATVVSNFMRQPFYTELRTRQQLGYIVGSGAGASRDQGLLLYVIQSSEYPADALRTRAERVITSLPDQLIALSPEEWTTLIAGAKSEVAEKAKSIAEKAERLFARAYDYHDDWERQADTLAALDTLDQSTAATWLAAIVDPAQARVMIELLDSDNHPASEAAPAYSDREIWKTQQTYR